MVLHFPSQDIFRLALTSGVIPSVVQIASVRAVYLPSGDLFVAPKESLGPSTLKSLSQLNVRSVKGLPKVGPESKLIDAVCWMQLVQLERLSKSAETFEKATVLFRTENSAEFAALIAEMLRLGNDRQSFRHYHVGKDEFSLLRVIDPPYYSLLSAIERVNEPTCSKPTSRVTAFTEQSPRVWVQTGYQHPMAARIDPPAGQFVLLEPATSWQFVNEAAFQDVYSALDLRLPSSLQALTAIDASTRIEIPLRLVPGGTNTHAELWVLRERAMEQVEELVTRSDDELLSRLAFAVVETGEQPIVILRTRPSRLGPPVIVLEGLACAPYLKLPNLYLPVGKRLHPPLRRDAVGKLLAGDNRKLTWLDTDGALGFKPLSISDSAFRPLNDWIDYVIEHEKDSMNAWVAAHRFEFESFVCRDDAPTQVKPVPGSERSTTKQERPQANSPTLANSPTKFEAPGPVESNEPKVEKEPAKRTPKPTLSEIQLRLAALEKKFLESADALDSEQTQAAWQKMGVLHSHLKHRMDTTVAWCNCLWNSGSPAPVLLQEWLQSEMRSSGRERIDISAVDEIMSKKGAGATDASLVAAFLIYSLASNKGLSDLKRRNAGLVQYFQKNERFLPIRTVWMTALAMHQQSGSDTLGLARVRDRVLERLFQQGMQAELDVASFMRGGSHGQNDRFRVLATQYPALLARVDRWLAVPTVMSNPQNKHYAQLIGAFGLAKLGQLKSCRNQMEEAVKELDKKDAIHKWMAQAYRFRIEQVAESVANSGPLPVEMMARLESMDRLDRYKVDRLRQQSRILEPHERVDPYRRWHRRYRDELFQSLAELYDITDHQQIRVAIEKLLKSHSDGPRGLRVLATALELAPRLGEQFALQMLPRVENLLRDCEDDIEKSLLLQRAVYVAAHFGQIHSVQGLVNVLQVAMPGIVKEYLTLQMQYNPDNKERVDTVETLFLQSFRGLRKLGMRDQIGELYGHVAQQVQSSRPKGNKSGSSDPTEARSMRLLLCVASGWYYFGQNEEADKVVERVRKMLFDGNLAAVEQRALAIAYVNAVAQAPVDDAVHRIQELFTVKAGERVLPRIEDNLTTSTHFSVSQMELIEASVLALLSESSALSPECQRWLDEDEFLVRKRIHGDMKRALGTSD